MFKVWQKAYHATHHFVKKSPFGTIVSRMHSGKGIVFALLAALLYATIGVSVKMASTSMDSQMMVWCRQTIGLLVFLPIFLVDKSRNQITLFRTSRPGLQIFRACTSLAAAYCLFYALSKLDLTNAILLSYTRPLWLPIVVWIIMKKRMEKAVWIGLAVGFIGVILVLQPTTAVFELASLAGLLSGVIGAVATLCIRWLAKTQPANQITLYYFLFSAIISSVPLFWLWETPDLQVAGWLLLIGIFSAAYQMCLTRAYRYGRATIIGGVLYSVLIFSALYEWMIWEKVPSLLTWLGILLICASSIFTLAMTQKRPMR